jgi:O-antigen/teichoic acid export membrane protein
MREAEPRPRRGFGADVILLAAARLSTVIAFFAVSVVGARLLDPESLGSAAVGQTVGMIAALVANGGLNIATIYFLQQRRDERDATVPRLAGMAIAGCVAAVVLVIIAAPIVMGLVVEPDAWPLMLTAAAMGAAMLAFEFAGALLLGLGRSGGFIIMELVRGLGSLAAVAILLVGPWRDDSGFVLGLALGYGGAAIVGLVRTHRSGMSLRPRYDSAFTSEALRFGIKGQAGNLFQFLGVRLDLLLVPALLDLRAAGIYVIAVRMSDVVGQVATAASSLVFPRVAAQNDRRSTELTERATRMILLAVAGSTLLLAITGEIVLRIAFGEVYAAGTGALLILLAAMLPLSLGRVVAADLKGRGRPDLVSWAALLSVVATVGLDVALIPVLGIEGAAIASLLGYAASTAVLILAYRTVTGGQALALLPRGSDIRAIGASVADVISRFRRSAT